jgi:hypothetical protein
MENKKIEPQNIKSKKINKIIGLDIDKAEYKEIVMSQSNFPDKNYYK